MSYSKKIRDPKKIRNIAIIAHIDHGKTTLLDSLLKQSNIFRENEATAERMMDNYDQEKERGITIFAKHTSIEFEEFKINIIDTPGHADFSGEVERVLGMVNSVLLLIDAQEGPMPQTRFVLAQALKVGLKPIVVLNKIDRPHANPDRALNLTFDLFVELGANDQQLEFSICYASGLSGFATREPNDPRVNMRPLFEMIIENVSPPPGNLELPFLMQASTLSYDDFVGRQACGRILEGKIAKGQTISRVDVNGHASLHKVTRIEGYHGLKKVEVDEAGVGDIICISGIAEITIGDTLCDPSHIIQLPPITLAEPTLSVELMVNNSPFVGKDGKHVTMNKIRERLAQEKLANISLKIEDHFRDDAVRVCGRGELHLAVLIEAMRREGYEFTICKPQVILKEIEKVQHEPFENVHIEVPQEFSGSVIEELSRRKAEMRSLSTNEHGITSLEFLVPTRGLMGYRNDFLTITKGLGILTSVFDSYAPWKGPIEGRPKGVLISNGPGKVTGYASFSIQNRGTLFVAPGDDVYEGMIVGENNRDNDLVVNIVRGKQLTNVRASGTDENIILSPPRKFTLEQAIDFIEDDELIETTPHFIRLRKKYLSENERKRA
ncbi:translational GTPase TypA [Candidatus Rhabdochlamydia porcellionis]|uniref:Large ribosomal subunit assembly factor BipA n=1 Tax=Candidatus Rhabdochlamydia porcellionis TaxID=225148 RepID=A0ABX8YZB6_9BACT|nr:translational GTPase TypA [Candidatus Rhabdochlamydia porcellionis]QZA58711.1 GTP-binding protein TypA/BipA [Candidatus Rhabdochlamydia porcellionis]